MSLDLGRAVNLDGLPKLADAANASLGRGAACKCGADLLRAVLAGAKADAGGGLGEPDLRRGLRTRRHPQSDKVH